MSASILSETDDHSHLIISFFCPSDFFTFSRYNFLSL